MSISTQPLTDNLVIAFHLEGQPVRGRIVRLGSVLDGVLVPHNLPEKAAELLGEAMITAILSGSSLKFDGRVIVHATGDGPVSFLVSDYTTDGGVRGYIRVDADQLNRTQQLDLGGLMGKGQFALTIDPGKAEHRYQGITALEASSFAQTAENYLNRSEQVPSRLIIAIARHTGEDGQTRWRGGGLLVQRIAGEDTDHDNDQDGWRAALALVQTVGDDELTDPMLTTEKLLFRLFHEQGVRTFTPLVIEQYCTCSKQRLKRVLGNFTRAERREMVMQNGLIEVKCEYCATTYDFTLDELV